MSSVLPLRTRLFAMLCDPLRLPWRRANDARATFGTHVYPCSRLRQSFESQLSDMRSGVQPARLAHAQALNAPDRAERLVRLSADGALKMAQHVDEWIAASGDRVRLLLAEASKADPEYLVREAAAHLQVAQPQVGLNTGIKHSHENDSTSCALQGPEWDEYVAAAAPALRQVARSLQGRHHGLFGDAGVTSWWPWL